MSTQTSIITQHNILNPHDRMVLPTYATHSSQILNDLLIADGFEVTLYKNSELQLEPFDIKHGDIINVVFIPMGGGGKGKSIISLVAMIGLAVFAPELTATMIGGLGIEVSAMGFYALQAGVMVAGSLLINSVLSPSTPSLSLNDNLSTSTTYSWDESYNKFQQGLSIPKVFGTHKITPPLISKYIETIDNKQYFNGLYAVNDGEVNSITDIKINDESIENFDDVEIEIRYGTLNQALIPNFDNVRSDKGVSRKLSTDFVETETNGNQVISLTATLLFPRGLFYANNDGSIGSNSVKITLEYSNDGIIWNDLSTDDTIPQYYYGYDWENGYFRADGLNGNFIEWVNKLPAGAIRYQDGSSFYRYNEWYYTTSYTVPYTTITDSSTSTLRKTFNVSNLTPNKYYIRAKFYENPPSGSRYGSDCYLEYITEEVGDDFIYPSTALISIRALATDQLSGSSPKISCIVSTDSSESLVYSTAGDETYHTHGTYATDVQIKVGVTNEGQPIYDTLMAYKRFIAFINPSTSSFEYNKFYLNSGVKYAIKIKNYVGTETFDLYTFTPKVSGYYSKIIPDEGTLWDSNTDIYYPSPTIGGWTPSTDEMGGYTANNGNITILLYGKTTSKNNPSSICRKMLIESGITENRILSSFIEWEAHCDLKEYYFNGVIDTSMTLRKALDLVSAAGRGSVIQFGSKFGVIMDRKEEIPVQSFSFGMGNILKDSFSQSFLPILDRANVIEATYYDADLDYEPTIVEVSNNNYDSVAEENRTSVTLVGFTNRQQAIKHCRYLLNCNRYLTEMVSIEADKDSLVCKYGDIVRVSHDVPQYGFSGRIKSCTLTTVTIDREVTMVSGKNYYIQLKDNENNIIEHYINNSLSTTDTLTFTTTLTEAYTKYDNYSFGEVGKASKLFRVLRISTASDMTRKLELLEYNEDVYNDSGDIEVPSISSLGISNLRATDFIRYSKDGTVETVMQLSWSGASLYYTVKYKKSSEAVYTSVKVYQSSFEIIAEDVSYDIIVKDAWRHSISLTYNVQGKLAPPDPITNLTCTESGGLYSLAWEYPNKPIDFSHYRIYSGWVTFGTSLTESFEYFWNLTNHQDFSVVAVDTSGVESAPVTISKTAQPPLPISSCTCTGYASTYRFVINDYEKPRDFKSYIVYYYGKVVASCPNDDFTITIPPNKGALTFQVAVQDTLNLVSTSLWVTASYENIALPSNISITVV